MTWSFQEYRFSKCETLIKHFYFPCKNISLMHSLDVAFAYAPFLDVDFFLWLSDEIGEQWQCYTWQQTRRGSVRLGNSNTRSQHCSASTDRLSSTRWTEMFLSHFFYVAMIKGFCNMTQKITICRKFSSWEVKWNIAVLS